MAYHNLERCLLECQRHYREKGDALSTSHPSHLPQTTMYSGCNVLTPPLWSDGIVAQVLGETVVLARPCFFSSSIVLCTFYRFPCCCCCLPACGGPALFGISPLVADRFLFRPTIRWAGAVVPVRPYGGSGLLGPVGLSASRERSPGSRLLGRCR